MARRLLIYFPIDNIEIHDILQAAKRSFPNSYVGAVDEGILVQDDEDGLIGGMHIDVAIAKLVDPEITEEMASASRS